jgi:hypothetical protein
MTDDLVKQLRFTADDVCRCGTPVCLEAADRIEKLEEEIGVLFAANVRLNSRADLDSDGYVDRIKKLEAALHRISLGSQDSGSTKEGLGREARKALEGENEKA